MNNNGYIKLNDVNEIVQAVEVKTDAASPVDTKLSNSFMADVGFGTAPGYTMVNKFGRNDDVDTATTSEAVWDGGGLYTGFNAVAAQTLEIVSDNANDSSGGTGARTLTLQGLDGSYNSISETIALNGLTTVTTSLTYLRCDRAFVATAGSIGYNLGLITANQSTATSNIMFTLPIEKNQTHICAYTVPAGKTAILMGFSISMLRSGTAEAECDIYVREFGGVFRSKHPVGVTEGGGGKIFNPGYSIISTIPEKSDIVIRVDVVSVNNTIVTAGMDMLLIDN